MPAYEEEVLEAEREGVRLETLMNPTEIVGTDGRAEAVRCCRMQLGAFDRSGRRRPVPADSGPITVDADHVIIAVGQALRPAALLGGTEVALTPRGFVAACSVTGQTSVGWLFSGGDAVTGPSSVVEAVAAGERAAVGIDRYLTGEDHSFWREHREVDTFFDPDADPVPFPRAPLKALPVERRRGSFQEVELPWSEGVALREAQRCLRCDYRTPED